MKNKFIQLIVFDDYINDLSYLDENYFQKSNVLGIKINGFYKNLKIFSKISKDFLKFNINYNFNILKLKISPFGIFGVYSSAGWTEKI